MNLEAQLEIITNTLEESKAVDTISLRVLAQSADIEAIVVTTGRSAQHIRGLSNNVKNEAKRLGMRVIGVEGLEVGDWVLIDLVEVVVHIMNEDARAFYKLEKLWNNEN